MSHWDWDHIGALAQSKVLKTLPQLCILSPPQGAAKKSKQKLLERFTRCDETGSHIFSWIPSKPRSSNEASQVFSFKNVLMPGDSTTKQEGLWSQRPWVPLSHVLVLGHHGSNTSTSQSLLCRMRNLKMAVSSARWRRYSHPPPETVARLKKARVPLLRTEDWGHIWLE